MKGMIVSVGGTPEPLIRTILEHKPDFVCFFVSQQSIDMLGDIKRRIKEGGHSIEDYKVVCDDANDLIHCYETALLCADKICSLCSCPYEVVVDYTGGTKTMSVALALATVGHGFNFSYVGGTERTKNGLGMVVTGKEIIRTEVSPWHTFAVEEKKRISLFVSTYQFEAAIAVMNETLDRLAEGEKEPWEGILEVLKGFLAWDNFNHKDAVKRLNNGLKKLKPLKGLLLSNSIKAYIEATEASFAHLDSMQRATNFFQSLHPLMVKDMVSNASRRYSQGKYDDAVARLYRTLEMVGQIAFESRFGCKTSEVPLDRVPSSLQEEYKRKFIAENGDKLKIPLFATFRILKEVGDPVGERFDEHKQELKNLLAARNSSILAHGSTPISKETYERFEKLLRELFLEGELIVFPKLDW